jgi:TPR repeat protein
MRTSRGLSALLLLLIGAGAAWASQPAREAPAQAALERGLEAYRAGAYEAAIAALKEAASKGGDPAAFFAEFYLARVYADNAGAHTDHAKAFALFRKLADENADIDPDDDQRAPFVAKAFIALAGYVRDGLKDMGIRPNPRRAASYLHHAAIFFGDKEAQFELARLYLSGEASKDDVRRALHYLSALSVRSYPAAQALLAELFWNGRHVRADERRALALITMAVENAPAHDRIWIEEIYQNIFCAAPQRTRREADGIMARWRKTFARPDAVQADLTGLGAREMAPERRCSNGETVAIRRSTEPPAGAIRPAAATGPVEVIQGGAMSLGFRAAGAAAPATSAK